MTHPTPVEIKHAISEAIHKHNAEVDASGDRYNEKLRRKFPAGALSLIAEAISKECEAHRMAAIKAAGEVC